MSLSITLEGGKRCALGKNFQKRYHLILSTINILMALSTQTSFISTKLI